MAQPQRRYDVDVNTSVLVVIDFQNDFCSGGPLAVPDADAILPVVNGLAAEFERVIVTQDWHPPGHVSFVSSHPGRSAGDTITLPWGKQLLWPDHCIAGTAGAELHPGLVVPSDAVVLRKGVRVGCDAYSAFFENDGVTLVGLDRLLRAHAARGFVLVGLATDVCVLHTALDGRRLGYDVTVVESACRGIDVGGSLATAWDRMTAAGVRRA
jgi:nicotinamidase-related amidase